MTLPNPASFYPQLSEVRLRIISSALLDIRHETLGILDSPYDDNYTRESSVFGRSKNLLIKMAMSGDWPWMRLSHGGMDVTFEIGGIPCRFFRDDPANPEKSGFFKRNAMDSLFDNDEATPVMWRFVVERALSADDEDRVHFVGYNLYHEKVAEWTYRGATQIVHSIAPEVPPSIPIPAARAKVKRDKPSEDDYQAVGDDR